MADIFCAIIAEIIVICLAIVFKPNKRIVVAALVVGTLLAGIIVLLRPMLTFDGSLPKRSLSNEDISSLPDSALPKGSLPNVELMVSISDTQVITKLDTIWTYKARGTVQRYTGTTSRNGDSVNVLHLPAELEYTRPYRLHSMLTYPDGKIDETITVGDRSCNRHGQQGGWFCSDRESFPVRERTIREWIEIVKGQASSNKAGDSGYGYGVRVYTWHNKKCRLYYKIETDWMGSGATESVAFCIDPDTLLPVYFYSSAWFDAPDRPYTEEFDVFDINKPIDISLPVQ